MSTNGNGNGKVKQTVLISYVITFVWVVSFFVDIFIKGYEPPPSVHALMMLVAGALFGEGLVRKRGREDSPVIPPTNPSVPPELEEGGPGIEPHS